MQRSSRCHLSEEVCTREYDEESLKDAVGRLIPILLLAKDTLSRPGIVDSQDSSCGGPLELVDDLLAAVERDPAPRGKEESLDRCDACFRAAYALGDAGFHGRQSEELFGELEDYSSKLPFWYPLR